MICLVRSDERLIHGQCMQFIVSDFSIKTILVVDDSTATNPILKSIFQTAVPQAITANVYTLQEAIPFIKDAVTNSENTLLLMKNPRTLVPILEQVEGVKQELNIGPQMARNGVKCADFATLHPEDIEACKKLTDMGVRVYFNSIGASGSVTEWSSVAKKI
ncbi:PTS sugar transporter subunit IIB [Anaerorhabdus sp.]|uniref:PTS sugar transporter subunit IIB n=1 Tax=Anaerorhabdus sp. TaxID=1872524 RepID=UPI002FC7C80E